MIEFLDLYGYAGLPSGWTAGNLTLASNGEERALTFHRSNRPPLT